MQIPHPKLNSRARALFRRIYRNDKIDLDGIKDTLKEQLDLYLEHFEAHLNKKLSIKDKKKIFDIIQRNNQVASIVNSPQFRRVTEDKRKLMGDTSLGLIYCIDGRIPAIFLGGRYASHWEVPAAEIKVTKRKSDKKLIPESNELCEALRKLVTTEQELLEIVLAHTSLLDPHHGCGAMAAKRKQGQLDPKLSNEEANIKIIEEKTIPSITNLYNEFREQKGFEPLLRVGISAIYDTDTFGVIFNYEKKGQSLSTTQITNDFKDQIEEFFAKDNLVYGSFKERFTYLKYLSLFSKNVLMVTGALLEDNAFSNFSDYIDDYTSHHYSDLSKNQLKALKFFIARTVAFQFLAGSCTLSKKKLDHPFAHHEEEYMAVSTRGTTIGKYDPQNQGFCSTPADTSTAVMNIKTKLSIMKTSSKKHPTFLLFICNPVNVHDLAENNIQLHKIMDANAELFRGILEDKELGSMIENIELIPIPVLIEEDNREVLKIIDHSAYL